MMNSYNEPSMRIRQTRYLPRASRRAPPEALFVIIFELVTTCYHLKGFRVWLKPLFETRKGFGFGLNPPFETRKGFGLGSNLSLTPGDRAVALFKRWSSNNFNDLRSVFIISNRKISNWASQILKNKFVAYLSVLSQISNCQGLGPHKYLKFWKLTGHFNNWLKNKVVRIHISSFVFCFEWTPEMHI